MLPTYFTILIGYQYTCKLFIIVTALHNTLSSGSLSSHIIDPVMVENDYYLQ